MPEAGVPEIVAVPLPWSVRLNPEGSVLEGDSDRVGVGYPLACTVTEQVEPTEQVVEDEEVIEGASSTVKVKLVEEAEPTVFEAETVIGNKPPWVGLPERTPEEDRLTPVGSGPDSENVGAG